MGSVLADIQLSKKEEKREERNRIAGLSVIGARWRNQQLAFGVSTERYSPPVGQMPKASTIVSASIIAPLNSGYRQAQRATTNTAEATERTRSNTEQAP